jgi:hypothetical protein
MQSRRGVTYNAGYVGRTKQARAVSRHAGNELLERERQNAGTDRYGGASKATIAVIDDDLVVSFKAPGKRKVTTELYPMIADWADVVNAWNQEDGNDEIDDDVALATDNPRFFWLARYHNRSLLAVKKNKEAK